MSTLALSVMVLVCGLVWGGFLVLVIRMTRSERRKRVEIATEDRQ